jgi:hypothetical protein
MGLQHESLLMCTIIYEVGLGATYPAMIGTLAATSHGPNTKNLAEREVLVHRRTTFRLCTCGLHRCTITVALR